MSDTESSTPVQSHPIVVVEYCKICSLPTEYCEYGPSAKQCLKENGPHPNNNKNTSTTSTDSSTNTDNTNTTTTTTTTNSTEEKLKDLKIVDDSKEVSHVDAGKSESTETTAEKEKSTKKKKEVKPQIIIEVNQRNKRKHVTKITGLELYGIKLSDAAKVMAKKFSCGCSVVKSTSNPNSEDIDIQGDFGEEVVDLIEEKYPTVPLTEIYFLEDKKKVKAR
ncbi:hypothetical protein RB653_006753 [Dictyostelium firmibasis]|uniref:SUI1 domain-containing protein n=1 Tax=Dictyostelium firmibasis TaxID=79012 RepID=A0AAN7TUY0_9MYCE